MAANISNCEHSDDDTEDLENRIQFVDTVSDVDDDTPDLLAQRGVRISSFLRNQVDV